MTRLTAALLLVALCAAASPAHAQVEEMRRDMHHYFAGESAEGWVFLGIGTLALGGAAYAAFGTDDEALHGAAWPVAIIGAIQLAAGLVLEIRTPGQVDDLDAQLDSAPAEFRDAELTRMEAVAVQFDWLAVTEVALILAGGGLATWALLDDEPFWAGVGIGLAAQAAIMLVLDLFAAARADDYIESLERFTP